MPATINNKQGKLETLRESLHKNCCVCSPDNPLGLQMQFEFLPDGKLKGIFDCSPRFEGYPGIVQGGVVASVLDGIMTNYLFAQDVVAVTAELKIRYRHPVQTGLRAELFAEIENHHSDLYLMKAQLFQSDKLHATATAKFLTQPHLAESTKQNK